MREITYDSIKMLIDSDEVAGRTVKCVFSCPVTGMEVESTGRIPDEVGPDLADDLRDLSLAGRVRSALATIIWDMVGAVAKSGSGDDDSGAHVDEDRRRAGILDAFRRVSHRFAFDPEAREWLAAGAAEKLLTPFGVQLNKSMVEEPRDVEVTERMLVEVARADGVFAERERDILAEFVGDARRVEELAAMAPLEASDFAGVSTGDVRRTMLMLAWAAAFTDESLAEPERSLLAGFAEALGLAGDEAGRLELLARDYVIDAALDEAWADLEMAPGERSHVESLARTLGVSDEDVARIEAAYRKRMGQDEPAGT